jgi:glycosyltransferase involved in cell wall biosynthesis
VSLLLAIAELGPVADGWTVDIAGSGEPKWRLKLEAAIRRKGADDRVRFVAADDLATQNTLLKAASLVVTPALHYDAGVSIPQAAAARVPVIATAFATPPGLEDAVAICEPKRDALRAALHALMSGSDADRNALGRRGYEAARRSLDWSVLAPQYAAFYAEVAHN